MVVVVLSLACVLDFGGAGGGAGACRMLSVHFRITNFKAFYS